MCLAGAKNETAKQLRELLCLDDNKLELLRDTQSLMLLINKHLNDETGTKLNTANKTYVMKGYELNKDYVKCIEEKFASAIEELDFGDNKKAATKINEWVSERTNEKIRDLIDSDALSGETRLVLVNAIYFKGDWRAPFNKELTISDKFHLPNAKTMDTKMMRLFGERLHLIKEPNGLQCDVCDLPYANQKMALRIILPHNGENIFEFEKSLAKSLASISKMRGMTEKVNVHLPKFLITSKAEVRN